MRAASAMTGAQKPQLSLISSAYERAVSLPSLRPVVRSVTSFGRPSVFGLELVGEYLWRILEKSNRRALSHHGTFVGSVAA